MMTNVFYSLCGIALLYFFNPNTELLDALPEEAPGKIEFIGEAGGKNTFTIKKWAFTKIESVENPENIKVEAILDTRSIECEWKELQDGVLKKKGYFHVKKFPEILVSIDGATANGDGSFETQAKLTIKGVTNLVPLKFTISEQAPYRVQAEGVIYRSKFKFKGNGPKEEVPVKIDANLVM